MKAKMFLPVLAVMALAMAGCENTGTMATGPNSESHGAAIHERARAALEQMEAADASLRDRINNAYAYAIFPEVGQAAVGIGGAGGHGVVFQQGNPIGYATLHEGSVGAQIGGNTYSELILFKDADSMAAFRNGNLTLGADAQATLVKSGAAATGQFVHGTQVFVLPKGGLMAGVAIDGQVIHYQQQENYENNNTTNNP